MKRLLISALVLSMIAVISTGCSKGSEIKSEGVLNHDEFITADLNSTVTIETYVQANQSWWNNSITLYTQDRDGGYFIYSAVCTEEDAAKLLPGTKIRVTGTKQEWSGEVEIAGDPTIEILDGTYNAIPTNITSMLGTDELWNHQNKKIIVKDLTVEPANEAGEAVLYGADGTGEEGDDLYLTLSTDGKEYTFVVESYLCDKTTTTYQTAKALKVGDTVDVIGYLYWYNGPQPHIDSITVK